MTRIVLVAHDAGGAQVLAALARKYKSRFDWNAVAAGPATKIFKQAGIQTLVLAPVSPPAVSRLIKAAAADLVLTGTSWGSDLELSAMRACARQEVSCVAVLDHWTNFTRRFGKDWRRNLPSHVAVGDEFAYRIARAEGLPKDKMLLLENPFWESFFSEQPPAFKRKRIRILYIGKATSRLSRVRPDLKPKFSEDDLLNAILRAVQDPPRPFKVRYRPHPAADPGKTAGILAALRSAGLRVNESSAELSADLRWADVLVGFENFPLALGAVMQKKSISFLPKPGAACSLPLKEIIKADKITVLRKHLFSPASRPSSFARRQKMFNDRYALPKVLGKLLR